MTSNPASVGPAPDGEWIEWSGGANPVPGAEVEFRIRVAQQVVAAPANTLRWHHWGHNDDIIAYRIAPHPDREAEPTSGWNENYRHLCCGGRKQHGHKPDCGKAAEPTGGVVTGIGLDLNDFARLLASTVQEAVRDGKPLTPAAKANVARWLREVSALSVSPPVVEGSLRASPCVPTEQTDGLVLVPEYPTEAMLDAGFEAYNRHDGSFWQTYRAMIEAARQSPTEGHEAAVVGDHPDADGTDAAHPAWWRGHEHTAAVFCQKVNELLDGSDDGRGVSNDPWERTRRRLLKLVQALRDLTAADTNLARAVNFCEPTVRLDELMLAEGASRAARNAALELLSPARHQPTIPGEQGEEG